MSTTNLPVREKETNGALDGIATQGGVRFGKELRKEFLFDEKYLNLNHGSFGTYPKSVRSTLRHFQDLTEACPDKFIRYTYPPLLDESRASIAKVLNCDVETVVFVPNATTAINTVLRNLVFSPGDKILYFATIYGACHKTISYITETTPAEAVEVEYTYPVSDAWLVDALKSKVREERARGAEVKIAVFDTVVSMPGVRMPFEKLTEACKELGVLSCIDGAHGVGHVPLDLGKLDPDFFVSNCHKWLFVPRGCAIFHVPIRNQPLLRSTLPTSHGFIPKPQSGQKFSSPFGPSAKSDFVNNFEFVGTIDNGPYLCIPAALEFRESLGGEKVVMAYCTRLVQQAAENVASVLGTEVLENGEGTLTNCCLANVRLPLHLEAVGAVAEKAGKEKDNVGNLVRDWMGRTMVDDYSTFMALFFYGGGWWVRFSGQVYLEMEDFEWAGGVLKKLCERVMAGEFLV
ncbi:PLP-dependent transferase [Lepidopterella palustris CBS 459.81]|uniref:PLP-dependent transferase n=1 Tax=Lepidopterella palustris CBS 459.81 TaxID=1314670 RepID=A0A8E2ECC6_9PEZI|nr:PLP-dependent transferase [Lepidopterella palustris CBS 459.81]